MGVAAASRIAIDLLDQRWDKVYGDLGAGLRDDPGNITVPARSVQPHPGHDRHARARMAVVGLVHMEQEAEHTGKLSAPAPPR